MKTQIKQKWFFPAQGKIKSYLKEQFHDCYRCEFQDVCKLVVYEMYQCWKPKEEGKSHGQRITFIIHKPISKQAVSIIEVMYSKFEHTMQFFHPHKNN